MGPSCSNHWVRRIIPYLTLGAALLAGFFAAAIAAGQDLTPGITYVCNGERVFIENCNIRDLSDTATCMVGHPDHVLANGLMQYTTMTRGALKKLFPACKQPSAKEVAAAKNFQQRQQALYDANVRKANNSPSAAPAQAGGGNGGQQEAPKTPEQRALARCITSGRLPASCTGNSLLGAFGQMLSQVLPSVAKEPAPGPNMAGVFQGAGNWRLDFIDNGVLVNCSFLSPNQENYTIEFKDNRTVIVIDTTPKPLVLTLRADGTIAGPGPVTINGVVATGSSGGGLSGYGPYYDANGRVLPPNVAAGMGPGQVYDGAGNRVAVTPVQATFSPRRATCPALNLSSKGAGVGIQTMQTDLLKTMFGGDKGPPTPPGIRMHGIFAASTGFSVQFFPESVILGCGPDAARAYPYTVIADGTKAVVKIDAPDHPLTLAFRPDGSLDPGGSGPYQVHGRTVTGQDNNDDFTFAPLEETCNLAVLTPSTAIPSSGGSPSTMLASGGGALSVPGATLGNATLSIISGFPPQPGAPNPLAGRPYVLLRNSYANALANGGVSVPPGMSPYKYVGAACGNRTPDCQKIMDAIKVAAASAARADANGRGTFPGVAPGSYYLMISTRYNNQALIWDMRIDLKPGANSITLDERNASRIQ